jgi:integrase
MVDISLWFNKNRKEKIWIHCHLFRHSFATRLYSESDISIKDLCKVMGHKDEQTIY